MRLFKNRTFIALLLAVWILPLPGWARLPRAESGMAPDAFWVNKMAWGPTHDLVAIGDSRVFMAISPQAMQSVFPDQRMVNFAFSACGLSEGYLQAAEDLLDPTSTHKTIVIGVSAFALSQRGIHHNEYLEYSDLKAFDVFKARYFGKFLHFFEPMNEKELKAIVRPTTEGFFREYYADGWIASEKVPPNPDSGLGSYQGLVDQYGAEVFVDEDILQGALDKVLSWRKQGIQVYVVRLPIKENLKTLEETVMQFDEAEIRHGFESAGAKWLSVPGDYFAYDGSHLGRDDALRFSINLAKSIQRADVSIQK